MGFSLYLGINPRNFSLANVVSKEFTHQFFNDKIAFNPLGVGIFTTVFVIINYIILKRGIIDGIENP